MRQDVRDLIARQQVDRILPPLGFWTKCALVLGWCLFAWIVFVVFLAGIAWWLETIAEWVA